MKIRTILRKGPDGIEKSADEATEVEPSFGAKQHDAVRAGNDFERRPHPWHPRYPCAFQGVDGRENTDFTDDTDAAENFFSRDRQLRVR